MPLKIIIKIKKLQTFWTQGVFSNTQMARSLKCLPKIINPVIEALAIVLDWSSCENPIHEKHIRIDAVH